MSYQEAKAKYAALGIDTDAAITARTSTRFSLSTETTDFMSVPQSSCFPFSLRTWADTRSVKTPVPPMILPKPVGRRKRKK